MNKTLKSPFPYFGGKTSCAHLVWESLGVVDHYIEPFFGSGAVLLNRPNWRPEMVETVNDTDSHICNVWRSLKFSPNEVAEWADWPVNHDDLRARKKCLIENESGLHKGCSSDPEWHDAKLAGYWIWAASCWIGHGLTSPGQIPHISNAGFGIHSKGQRPHIREWFSSLQERLRSVRVVVGDWTQVCGGNWQTHMGICGIFFDPPYSAEAKRHNGIYAKDSRTVAHDVRAWCIKRGSNPSYRICLAGYEGEGHEELEELGWTVKHWKAQGGYANLGDESSSGKTNRHKERLWFSPYCVKCELF